LARDERGQAGPATAFDPCSLAPLASINRVRLGRRTARELLSAAALAELVREAGLRPDAPVRSFLDACLAGEGPARRAAGTVAERFGQRLGTLLATLRAGNRAARPEWDDDYWNRWAGAGAVWLGGGLAGGGFGELVAERADAVVGAGCRVAVAPAAADLPLVGAATIARRSSGPALVLDFGHTLVKRAIAGYDGGELTSVRRLPAVPAPDAAAAGEALSESIVDILAVGWVEAGRPAGPAVAAMAAYVRNGQPVRTPLGTYTRLADVSDDVPGWLSTRLAARLGAELPLVLVHDGTAAAHALPPDPHSVVVLLGTSLGVGFPHRCPEPGVARAGTAA